MRRKTNFGSSLEGNMSSYWQYIDRLTEIAVSVFEWKNLPDTVDERFLEMTLYNNGCAVFFRDPDLGELALPVAANGRWNIYNEPIRRRAYATSGYNRKLDESDSVLIYNNRMRKPSRPMIRYFAGLLWDLDQTISVNARAQKTPVLIQATEKQRLAMLNLYKEYDGNSPVIFGDKNLSTDQIKAIQTGAPYVADKLYDLKVKYWNEALTYLGVPNVSEQKRERMITDEVIRGQGGTLANRYSRLKARQDAADKINQMFDLNIEVVFREGTAESDTGTKVSEVEEEEEEVIQDE